MDFGEGVLFYEEAGDLGEKDVNALEPEIPLYVKPVFQIL